MDAKAFKKKILPLRKKLLGYSFRLVENSEDAEDIVQETMLRLWNTRSKLDSYNNIEAYAMLITRNLSLDKLRARKPVTPYEHVQLFTEKADPQKQLEAQEAVNRIQEIIERLPTLQQLIIRMKDIEGMEISEIVEITGSTAEAVRSNLSRARKKVRTEFLMNEKNISYEDRRTN